MRQLLKVHEKLLFALSYPEGCDAVQDKIRQVADGAMSSSQKEQLLSNLFDVACKLQELRPVIEETEMILDNATECLYPVANTGGA